MQHHEIGAAAGVTSIKRKMGGGAGKRGYVMEEPTKPKPRLLAEGGKRGGGNFRGPDQKRYLGSKGEGERGCN